MTKKKSSKTVKLTNEDSNKNKSKTHKSNNSKHKSKFFTKRRIILLGILLLCFIILSFFGIIKLNFLIQNELHIGLSPLQIVEDINYDENINLSFNVNIDNFWFCNSFCEYQLYDPYTNQVLFFGNHSFNSDNTLKKDFNFKLGVNGHGQRHYYFEIECNNIRTSVCQTDESKTYRSSLITINYNLSKEEEELRLSLKDSLNLFNSNFNVANNDLNYINYLILEIANIIKTEISVNEQENKLDTVRQNILKFYDDWSNENYYLINNEFSEADINNLNSIKTKLSLSKNNILNYINIYNNSVKLFEDLLINNSFFDSAYTFYKKSNNLKYINISNLLNDLIDLNIKFKLTLLENVSNLNQNLLNLSSEYNSLYNKYNDDVYNLNADLNDFIEYHSTIINDVFNVLNQDNLFLNTDKCDYLILINNSYLKINNDALISLDYYSDLINNSEFKLMKNYFKKQILDPDFKIKYDSIKKQYVVNNSKIINNTLNLTKENYYSVIQFNFSSQIDNYHNIICVDKNYSLYLSYYPLNFISINKTEFNDSNDINFGDVLPKCCIFNECNSCEVQKNNYPIIFLHGHSFNEKTPVESSLNTFTKIQLKMSDDQFAINAGDMRVDTLPNEILSLMNKPLAIRASYYFVTYYDLDFYAAASMKSESLETYAIRLKETIDAVKDKTNSDKVILIAHSMGGLVARDYLYLFGESNVDKLILIGTPNYGIVGRTKQFCSSFGAKKECEDMYKDSIFLKKLNDPKNIPSIPIYMIYGIGCNMDGENGDGVVTEYNAKLDYAKNFQVNGSCSGILKTNLHTDLLNPVLYPEVYDKIVELLND